MHKKLISTVRILLFLALGIFLLAIAFRGVRLEDLVSGLKSANYMWVFISLMFAVMAFISRAWRWILLIEPLGYRPSLANSFYALMTGYLANFLLPRIGELTRCGSLNRTEKIPAGSLLGTVINERISDIVVLLVLLVTIFFIKIDFFGEFLTGNIINPLYTRLSSMVSFSWLIYLVIAAFLLLLLLFYRIIALWLRKYSLYRRLENIAAGVFTGMGAIWQMKKIMPFMLHTLFIWIMYFLMTWALFLALPATEGLGPADVLFILVVGGLGMSAPVQGGIGAYHWIVSLGLGLYGIPREEGLVFATLSHESQALLMLLLGSFSMLMVVIRRKKEKVDEDRNQQLKITGNG